MIDVHTFDCKLKDVFKPDKMYDINTKNTLFLKLKTLLTNQNALDCLQTIINDLNQNNGQNYDNKNNVDCTDILASIFDYINNENNNDIFILLEEQLSDTKLLGICPQGRTTRLIQLWLCII